MRSTNAMRVCRMQEYECFVALVNGVLLTCDIDEQGGALADDLGNMLWEPVRISQADEEFLAAVDGTFGTSYHYPFASYAAAA